MPVKSVPTMGWTRRSAAVTILQMTEAQQKEMGARVAQLRDAQGLTNEALARRAGLAVKTVSRFVHGKHEPRTNTIEALAKALKVPEREIRGAPPDPFLPADEVAQLQNVEARLGKIEQALVRIVKQLDTIEAAVTPRAADGEAPDLGLPALKALLEEHLEALQQTAPLVPKRKTQRAAG